MDLLRQYLKVETQFQHGESLKNIRDLISERPTLGPRRSTWTLFNKGCSSFLVRLSHMGFLLKVCLFVEQLMSSLSVCGKSVHNANDKQMASSTPKLSVPPAFHCWHIHHPPSPYPHFTCHNVTLFSVQQCSLSL